MIALVNEGVERPNLRGLMLKAHDPNDRNGRGSASWTNDVDAALLFETHAEAFAAWCTQSTVQPFRDDGKPNRPLTAYTISFMSVIR